MNRRTASKKTCPKSIRLLGDYWSLRIIESLKDTPYRYCELQRDLDNVNPTTLTKKLAALETAGLIERTDAHDGHVVSYSLTPLGTQSLPVLRAIKQFARAYEKHLHS